MAADRICERENRRADRFSDGQDATDRDRQRRGNFYFETLEIRSPKCVECARFPGLRGKSGFPGKSEMPSKSRATARSGYVFEKVQIRDLYESGATREPSEKALRARADRRHGILVFVESIGNTHYYDRLLSTIRVNAARRCKGPGVQWDDISNCLRKATLTPEKLRALLKDGQSEAKLTDALVQELSALLDQS